VKGCYTFLVRFSRAVSKACTPSQCLQDPQGRRPPMHCLYKRVQYVLQRNGNIPYEDRLLTKGELRAMFSLPCQATDHVTCTYSTLTSGLAVKHYLTECTGEPFDLRHLKGLSDSLYL